jgi:ADP-heptose:LPS heptosyltransferase
MSVGTKCEVKHWGADNWRQLTQRLSALPGLEQLFLVGSADEHQECEDIRCLWPRRAVNLCGQISARESAALMAAADLFVGHDSGPMHLAAAANAPLVAIFSSRAPKGMWFPLSARHRVHYTDIDCMGCGLERCVVRQKACINAISVDEVLESCWSLLEQVRRQEQIRQPAVRITG